MSIQSIEKSLRQRFAAPLPDFYKRRIIFWQDPDGEFVEAIDELHIDGVKVLKLTGNNNFYAKMLLSQSRKISNSIFSIDFYQSDAAVGKIVPATYEVYISDAMGQIVSDRQKVIADKTGENGADRVVRIRFTLKSMEFKKTESYFLMIVDKDTGGVLDKIAFNIDIAFVNDFDF